MFFSRLYLELDRAKEEKKKKGKKATKRRRSISKGRDRPIKRKAEAVEAEKKRENESLAGIMDSTDGNISADVVAKLSAPLPSPPLSSFSFFHPVSLPPTSHHPVNSFR